MSLQLQINWPIDLDIEVGREAVARARAQARRSAPMWLRVTRSHRYGFYRRRLKYSPAVMFCRASQVTNSSTVSNRYSHTRSVPEDLCRPDARTYIFQGSLGVQLG